MERLLNWINRHRYVSGLIAFSIPLLVVHILYKVDFGIKWLQSNWSAGELLTYIAGFEALLGTVILGIITVKQNESNLYLQKITAQKMFPVIAISNPSSYRTTTCKTYVHDFPKKQHFNKGILSNTTENKQIIKTNVDVEGNTPEFVKAISFQIINKSEAVIRHISVDDICIDGYQGKTEPVYCKNRTTGSGISCLLGAEDVIEVQTQLFFDNQEYEQLWDNRLGGISITFFVTNTTITGIQFHEFIQMRLTNEGYSNIKYGEGKCDDQ